MKTVNKLILASVIAGLSIFTSPISANAQAQNAPVQYAPMVHVPIEPYLGPVTTTSWPIATHTLSTAPVPIYSQLQSTSTPYGYNRTYNFVPDRAPVRVIPQRFRTVHPKRVPVVTTHELYPFRYGYRFNTNGDLIQWYTVRPSYDHGKYRTRTSFYKHISPPRF